MPTAAFLLCTAFLRQQLPITWVCVQFTQVLTTPAQSMLREGVCGVEAGVRTGQQQHFLPLTALTAGQAPGHELTAQVVGIDLSPLL